VLIGGTEPGSDALSPVPAPTGDATVITPDHLASSGDSVAGSPAFMVSNSSLPSAITRRGDPM
jgi:hypothetical protein